MMMMMMILTMAMTGDIIHDILMTVMMMVMILTMTMTGNIIQDLKGSNIIQGHEWSHLSDGSDEIARIRQK